VLAGHGQAAFMAGADIGEFQALRAEPGAHGQAQPDGAGGALAEAQAIATRIAALPRVAVTGAKRAVNGAVPAAARWATGSGRSPRRPVST
jgi:enoyl-CoA hydratase/carnithine racemase